MHELDDHALLRQFTEQNSETAFAALVERHVDKVYSTALRHTRNAHAAEEITQAVFVILAKKSGRLGAKVILAGWLYETARLTAVTYIRSEIRRVHREQEAHMQTALNENADAAWPHIAPLLDDALAGLSAADRHAVVLRYFDGKSLGEVGAALGASEDAAKKRVTRAVEKLRGWFTKRGVTLTATVLTAAISANSVQAAPLGLAKTISVIAITKGATAGGSTLALAKGALKIMAWTKAKMAILTGAAIILAAGTTSIVVTKMTTPSASDLSWANDPKYWEIDFGDPDPQKRIATMQARERAFDKNIGRLPPVLILRPSQFKTNLGMVSTDNKIIARGQSLLQLIRLAYDPNFTNNSILPTDFPRGNFDLLLTLKAKPIETLKDEIKNKFGFVAHQEVIETNVLILKVKHPAGPALEVTKGGLPSFPTRSPQNKIAIKNQEFSGIAGCFGALLKTRVINQTDIKGRYDIALQWQKGASETEDEAFKRVVLDQLGLEFIPSREAFNYLIVEKVK